jgi:C4-dicarboxylate-binding protein DctP
VYEEITIEGDWGMRKKLFTSGLALMVVILLFGANAFSDDKEVTIRFSYGLPSGHYISEQLNNWAAVTTKADKKLKVEMYGGAQLYKDIDAIEAVQTGAIESAMAYSFNLARMVPEIAMFDCPGLFADTESLSKALNSPVRQQFDAAVEKKNIKILAWLPWCVEEEGITSTKPLKVPQDAKGMTGRVLGAESAALWKHWGMNPTFLSGSEIYMALQRGVIQTVRASLSSNVERKYYEIAPNHTILPVGVVVTTIMINKEFFNKLSADQQQALVDAAKQVEGESLAAAKADSETVFKRAADLKIDVYKPTSEELKLWTAGFDDVIKEIYKSNPGALEAVQKVKGMNM